MRGPTRYFVGLDLGRPSEPTALAVLGRSTLPRDDPPQSRPGYDLRHLHRFPPGTPYPQILTEVRELLRSSSLAGQAWLLADYTGAGWPVQALFAQGLQTTVTCFYSPVILTISGTVVPNGRAGLAVPKADLVGTLQVLLQTRRLQISRQLDEAATLTRELAAYRPKTKLDPTDAIAWREGAHDDLVLAVGLAAWAGEAALPC
jgi:hypothetical protein